MSEGTVATTDERIDRILWASAGIKSAREVAKELGMKPEEVLRRRKELIEGVDDLTIQQTRQKLLIDLKDIARRTQEDYDEAPFEFKAGLMNSSIAAMKAVLVELNRADDKDQEKVDHLNALRVRELVNLIREVVEISVDELVEKYDLERDEVYAIFDANMQKAARMRDALTA